MIPSAILFDLDDTLADRAAGLREYAFLFYKQFSRELHPCSHKDVHEALLVADDFGSPQQAETLSASHLWRTPPDRHRLYDHWNTHFGTMATCVSGGTELLSELKGLSIKLGVVTNGGSAMQRSKLAALDIEELMDVVIISSEVRLRKPDPRIFALALAQLGCEPADAWFVGDHPEQDIQGAAAAGLTTFWIKTDRFNQGQAVPGVHLETLVALREHLSA